MSKTVADENKKLGQELISQEQRENEKKLSGKQEAHKMQNAQDILKTLQILVNEGEMPGTEIINDALLKAEQYLMTQSQSAELDPNTRKCLEDITLLIGSAKQMARNKDLGDRLQRIADETAKAVSDINQPGVPDQTRDASLKVVKIVENWRFLFDLLVSKREFRVLVVDTVKILRKVIYRHTKEGLGEQVAKKYISGESLTELAQTVTDETAKTFQPPQSQTSQIIKQETIFTPHGAISSQIVEHSPAPITVQVSDEEWELLWEDFFHILITLSKTPTYRTGIDRMFNLFDILQSQLSSASSQMPDSLQLHAARAQFETQQLISTFTGAEPLDKFITSLKKLVEKMDKELKTKQYLSELKSFILDTKTAEKINDRATKDRLRKFVNDGREIVEEFSYGPELDDFLDKSFQLIENIKNDEFVTVLRHHAGIVANDLSYVDRDGNVQLDTEMLGKLRSVISPIIAESLKYIPIPKIESDNEFRYYWVDNIVLCGYDVLPDKMRIHMESDSSINIREVKAENSETTLILTLENIRTEIKNLDFYYQKKTFPHLTEQGKVTLGLTGEGATLIIKYHIEQTADSVVPLIHKGSVDFQIHNFEIKFEQIYHSLLIPMITSMFRYDIQRQVESSVENSLLGLVNGIGEKLTSALVEVNRPLMQGMDTMRKALKATDMGTVIEKRKEKLE